MMPVVTSLLKETHVWNKALCLYFSFLCFPGGKWQMSGSRVGLSAPLKTCCYICTRIWVDKSIGLKRQTYITHINNIKMWHYHIIQYICSTSDIKVKHKQLWMQIISHFKKLGHSTDPERKKCRQLFPTRRLSFQKCLFVCLSLCLSFCPSVCSSICLTVGKIAHGFQ